MPNSRFDWIIVTIVVAVLGVAWIGVSRVSAEAINPNGRPPAPQIGHPAPDFTLTTLDGETVQLSDLRGQAVIINFWATWCGPCLREMPDIQTVADKYEDDLLVLAVNDAEPEGLVSSYITDLSLRFDILMDPTRDVQRLYQVRAFPTTFFIDKDGIVSDAVFGSMTRPIIENRVSAIVR